MEPRNLTILTINLTYTKICFASHNPLKHIFIPIIIILNNFVKLWTNIPAKGLHFKLHPTNVTFNAFEKINRLVINRTFNLCFSINLLTWKKKFQPTFHNEQNHILYILIRTKIKPTKSKSSNPFVRTSTILNTISQSHCTNQVKAWKKGPQNEIQNENTSNKTTNIKRNSKSIDHLITKKN
jgi:hypothetical protein